MGLDPAPSADAKIPHRGPPLRSRPTGCVLKKAQATQKAKKAGQKATKTRSLKLVPTGIERIEFVAVYADILSGPYDPEVAGLSLVASALLSLNEALTK